MELEIQHLLDIEAIEPVPRDQERAGFYSILFLVPKSSGGWRGILNLKQLNLFVLYRRFKMYSLRSILGCIREGDLLQSVDLKEAYIHVPIHPMHRQYLRFTYANRHYQYWAMPFGLISPADVHETTVSGDGLCSHNSGTRGGIPRQHLDPFLLTGSGNARQRDSDSGASESWIYSQ